MVEIRTFDGTAEEMHEFVVGVWRDSYAGRMSFPVWTPEYFRWQFDLTDPAVRNNQLAAYDGSRLVGTLFSIPLKFQTPRGEEQGSQGSWLTIHPDLRGQGIVPRLVEERVRRHRDRGAGLIVSYRFSGSRHSLAERPRPNDPRDSRYLRRVGFWARVLDPSRAARWNISRFDRWLTRLGGLLQPAPRVRQATVTIRPYTPADLPGCLELVSRQLRVKELAIHWELQTLGRLLGGGFGQCLVAVRDDQSPGISGLSCVAVCGADRGTTRNCGLAGAESVECSRPTGNDQFGTPGDARTRCDIGITCPAVPDRIVPTQKGPLLCARPIPRS